MASRKGAASAGGKKHPTASPNEDDDAHQVPNVPNLPNIPNVPNASNATAAAGGGASHTQTPGRSTRKGAAAMAAVPGDGEGGMSTSKKDKDKDKDKKAKSSSRKDKEKKGGDGSASADEDHEHEHENHENRSTSTTTATRKKRDRAAYKNAFESDVVMDKAAQAYSSPLRRTQPDRERPLVGGASKEEGKGGGNMSASELMMSDDDRKASQAARNQGLSIISQLQREIATALSPLSKGGKPSLSDQGSGSGGGVAVVPENDQDEHEAAGTTLSHGIRAMQAYLPTFDLEKYKREEQKKFKIAAWTSAILVLMVIYIFLLKFLPSARDRVPIGFVETKLQGYRDNVAAQIPSSVKGAYARMNKDIDAFQEYRIKQYNQLVSRSESMYYSSGLDKVVNAPFDAYHNLAAWLHAKTARLRAWNEAQSKKRQEAAQLRRMRKEKKRLEIEAKLAAKKALKAVKVAEAQARKQKIQEEKNAKKVERAAKRAVRRLQREKRFAEMKTRALAVSSQMADAVSRRLSTSRSKVYHVDFHPFQAINSFTALLSSRFPVDKIKSAVLEFLAFPANLFDQVRTSIGDRIGDYLIRQYEMPHRPTAKLARSRAAYDELKYQEFEERIRLLVEQEARKAVADEYASMRSQDIPARTSAALRVRNYEHVAEKVIERFAADRGGQPDYALESAGAYIWTSTPSRISQIRDYVVNRAIALAENSNYRAPFPKPPSTALHPDTNPGNCWAFAGSQASVTVHLARPIVLTMVTIDHASFYTTFSSSSAPKDFKLTALLLDGTEQELGSFVYHVGPMFPPAQTYPVKSKSGTRAVRLDILSNHGNPSYTCLYRMRVHGDEIPVK